MINLKKLFVVGAVAAIVGLANVNAYEYAGTKKYNFTEFEEVNNRVGILKYNDKLYAYGIDSYIEPGYLEEISIGDKIKTTRTELTKDVLREMYPNVEMYSYEFNEVDGFSEYLYTARGTEEGIAPVDLSFVPEEGYTWYAGYYKDKLYLVTNIEDEEENIIDRIVSVYKTDGSLIKRIKASDLLKKVEKEGFYYDITFIYVDSILESEEGYFNLSVSEYNPETETATYKEYIFNYDETLYTVIESDNYIEYAMPIYKDGKMQFIYQNCESEYSDCKAILTDGKEKTTILESANYAYMEFDNGFVIFTYETEAEKTITKIYDNKFNLIKEFDDVYVDINKSIEKIEDVSVYNAATQKEVTNGNYFVSLIDLEEYEVTKEYLLTVEDSKLVNISGILKDKDGNPLKDYTVELHSTVRTVTTDKNGYFKFDNVEEGKHTLTIKDSKGTVLATKEINVINGTETKLDGDTLTFNEKDNGVNINLKLDGTNLSIASVDKGVSVPKTFDTLTNSIILLITLTLSTIFIIKKSNRIKYIKN